MNYWLIDPDTGEEVSREELYKFDEEKHKEADEKYPDLEDKWCFRCHMRLVRGSMAYYEGYHFDSCI